MAAAAILKNRKILISSQPIDQFITKFGMLMRLTTLDSNIVNKISRFQKSKMAAAAILKNQKISISSQPKKFDEIWYADVSGPSLPQ